VKPHLERKEIPTLTNFCSGWQSGSMIEHQPSKHEVLSSNPRPSNNSNNYKNECLQIFFLKSILKVIGAVRILGHKCQLVACSISKICIWKMEWIRIGKIGVECSLVVECLPRMHKVWGHGLSDVKCLHAWRMWCPEFKLLYCLKKQQQQKTWDITLRREY
jgi:hypothetical protein